MRVHHSTAKSWARRRRFYAGDSVSDIIDSAENPPGIHLLTGHEIRALVEQAIRDYPPKYWTRAKVPGTSHKMITTSRIVRSEGRIVTTKSGSVYQLGTVDHGYVEYLASIGRTLDEANPVKVVGHV